MKILNLEKLFTVNSYYLPLIENPTVNYYYLPLINLGYII